MNEVVIKSVEEQSEQVTPKDLIGDNMEEHGQTAFVGQY